jgi:hypothetical protein
MATSAPIHRAFRAFRKLLKDQAGQDLLEYALMGALVASLAIALFPAIGSTAALYSHAMSALSLALCTTAGN